MKFETKVNYEYQITEKSITRTECTPQMCLGGVNFCSKVNCPLAGKEVFIEGLLYEEIKVWAPSLELFINYFGRHNIQNEIA